MCTEQYLGCALDTIIDMTKISKEERARRTGMNAGQVDDYIWDLRQRGYKLKEIGAAVNMTEMGVSHALRRISDQKASSK